MTHTLWALRAAGFEIWFKGGTSLSKGFALIERFSEDLDLKNRAWLGHGAARRSRVGRARAQRQRPSEGSTLRSSPCSSAFRALRALPG